MIVTLNFALWTLLTLGSAASAGLLISARAADRPGSRMPILPLGAAFVALLAVILGANPQTLFEHSPYGMYLLQASLPLVALLVTSRLVYLWYVDRPRRRLAARLGATAALLIACGGAVLFVTPETSTGVALAVLSALVLGGIGGCLPSAALRAAGLTVATASLWAAAFLVYLTVFPQQIAIGSESPGDGSASLPLAELTALAALGMAFVLGFLKIRRG